MRILPILLILILAGCEGVQQPQPEVEPEVPLAQMIAERDSALAGLHISRDEIGGRVFYYARDYRGSRRHDEDASVILYILHDLEDGRYNLVFDGFTRSYSRFGPVVSLLLYADGQRYTWVTRGDRIHGSTYIEEIRRLPTLEVQTELRRLAQADSAIVRFQGRDSNLDHHLTRDEADDLLTILDVYDKILSVQERERPRSRSRY